MKLSKRIAAGMLLLAVAATSQAGLIRGELHFAGIFSPTGGSSLADATGINVGLALALDGTDDLAPLAPTMAVMGPILFGNSAQRLWTIVTPSGIWAMDLDSVVVTTQTLSELTLRGSGDLTGPGFDPTPATWLFTGNCGNAKTMICSFSNQTTSVPEAPALAVLCLALACFAGRLLPRRRSTNRQSPLPAA